MMSLETNTILMRYEHYSLSYNNAFLPINTNSSINKSCISAFTLILLTIIEWYYTLITDQYVLCRVRAPLYPFSHHFFGLMLSKTMLKNLLIFTEKDPENSFFKFLLLFSIVFSKAVSVFGFIPWYWLFLFVCSLISFSILLCAHLSIYIWLIYHLLIKLFVHTSIYRLFAYYFFIHQIIHSFFWSIY